VKLRVLFGEAAHFRDGAAYYYPSGYTAYYVDIRTLTEDDVARTRGEKVFGRDFTCWCV
jgi:hypothetical protein